MILRGALPTRVRVVEVGPRDGLQNEPVILPLETKQMFVSRLAEAGLPVIEAGAFVRPDRVPQMADSDEVFRRLREVRGPVLAALVPNRQGLERALRCGVRAVAVFTAASDAFALRNINMDIARSLEVFREVVLEAHAAG